MLRRNRRAVMQESKQRIFLQEVFDRNISGPTVIVSKRQHKFRFRFHARALGNLARRHAGPDIVESRPARDAVKIGIDFDDRKLHEFVEREVKRLIHQSINFEFPRRQIDRRRAMRIKDRPFFRA